MNKDLFAECPPIIINFLGYIQNIKGKSSRTVEEYFFDLRTFFRYIKLKRNLVDSETQFNKIPINDVDIKLIETITLTDIFEYLNFTIDKRQNSNSTRARKSSSLKSFFKYLTNKAMLLKENPTIELESPKLKKSLPKYLTLEQSLELLNSVDGKYKERDYCILTLFLNCGLRLSELVNLNLSDIYPDNTMRVVGKGNKERIIYLNNPCIKAIEDYKKVRPTGKIKNKADKNALFISHLNKRMGRQAVQLMVNKYLDKIGLSNQGYSVHKLRHTAATLMYQHGNVDIRVLKDILGHENLGTTEIYTHLSNKQMQNAANSNPLANIHKKQTNE